MCGGLIRLRTGLVTMTVSVLSMWRQHIAHCVYTSHATRRRCSLVSMAVVLGRCATTLSPLPRVRPSVAKSTARMTTRYVRVTKAQIARMGHIRHRRRRAPTTEDRHRVTATSLTTRCHIAPNHRQWLVSCASKHPPRPHHRRRVDAGVVVLECTCTTQTQRRTNVAAIIVIAVAVLISTKM